MTTEILLYYAYVPIDSVPDVVESQRVLCASLGLKGRIIVAAEGINGTVEGAVEDTGRYVEAMGADPRFASITYKRSPGTGNAFPRLSIRERSEIVSAHLGQDDVFPGTITGAYLSAEELRTWFEEGREFYIVDMRNDYEHAVGRFKGSILPPLANFRDLPAALTGLEHLKDKTVVTVCTGGVRCEKASGYLLTQGFRDVYQLRDGIVSYMEKYPNQEFEGLLYVFDNRVTMGFNVKETGRPVVAVCERCRKPAERYLNCENLLCHRHFICCTKCVPESAAGLCGLNCLAAA